MKRSNKRHPCPVNRYLQISIVLFILLFALPALTVTMLHREQAGAQEPEQIEILPAGEIDSNATIRLLQNGSVEELSMSDYLAGVVRAEMPASFEQEALCAQAVAARTYTLYKILSGGNHGEEADICGDSTCCQAYLNKEAAQANWGADAALYEAKIENAVSATDGQTLLYDGEPILAVFHSSSAGQTKSSGEVWTSDLPYLQSVSSPEVAAEIPNYYSRVSLSASEFRSAFLAAHPEADLSGDIGDWIQDLRVSDSSSVDSVTIGGICVRGTEVRTIFSLRSASFEIETTADNVIFYVTGFGHGVGMSQYGANEMALEGHTWQEIVAHYYTGVTIASWSYDKNA